MGLGTLEVISVYFCSLHSSPKKKASSNSQFSDFMVPLCYTEQLVNHFTLCPWAPVLFNLIKSNVFPFLHFLEYILECHLHTVDIKVYFSRSEFFSLYQPLCPLKQ